MRLQKSGSSCRTPWLWRSSFVTFGSLDGVPVLQKKILWLLQLWFTTFPFAVQEQQQRLEEHERSMNQTFQRQSALLRSRLLTMSIFCSPKRSSDENCDTSHTVHVGVLREGRQSRHEGKIRFDARVSSQQADPPSSHEHSSQRTFWAGYISSWHQNLSCVLT